MALRKYLKNVADTIRNWIDDTSPINAQDFCEAINHACDTQYGKGSGEGYTYGYDDGYWEGHEEGYHQGEEVGYQEGYEEGYYYGDSFGYHNGYNTGLNEGYGDGWKEGSLEASPQETVSGEAIGITDSISPVEHNMGVSVRVKNIAQYTIYSGGKELVEGASYAETNFKLENKLPANTPLYFAIFTEDGVMVTTSGVSRTLRQKSYQVTGELQKDISSNTKAYTLTEDEANVASYIYVYMSGTVVNTYAGKTVNKLVISTEPITSYAPYIEDISKVKVYKCGSNLFNNDVSLLKNLAIDVGTGSKKYVGYEIHLPVGTYIMKAELSPSATSNVAYIYTCIKNKNNVYRTITNLVENTFLPTPKPFTIEDGDVLIIYDAIENHSISSAQNYFTRYNIMINVGETVLPYEPYIEPFVYDVATDGTVEGVKSLYPNTTLYTDTSGAVIDCTYYQDGKKVKENLIDMILSLGGVINE